jgi:hypothetical protein
MWLWIGLRPVAEKPSSFARRITMGRCPHTDLGAARGIREEVGKKLKGQRICIRCPWLVPSPRYLPFKLYLVL